MIIGQETAGLSTGPSEFVHLLSVNALFCYVCPTLL